MFFDLAQTLRSLTASPMSTAIDQARRMAQRRLDTGGTVGHGRDDDHPGPEDCLLPDDIDPLILATAIEDGRRGSFGHRLDGSGAAPLAIQITADGRILVPRLCLERLGGGAVDRGKRLLDRVISDLRARRTLMRSRMLSSGG